MPSCFAEKSSNSEREPPARLYRYQPFTPQSLDALRCRKTRFSNPSAFNDPYDCAYTVRQRKPNPPEETRAQLKEAISRLRSFQDEISVACFSEVWNNRLMWALYAGHHSGFCLEFDARFEPFCHAKPVVYTNDIPTIDQVRVAEAALGPGKTMYDRVVLEKAPEWSHEKEWRIVRHSKGDSGQFPAEALTAVYFGPRLDFSNYLPLVDAIDGATNEWLRVDVSRETFDLRADKIPRCFLDIIRRTFLPIVPGARSRRCC